MRGRGEAICSLLLWPTKQLLLIMTECGFRVTIDRSRIIHNLRPVHCFDNFRGNDCCYASFAVCCFPLIRIVENGALLSPKFRVSAEALVFPIQARHPARPQQETNRPTMQTRATKLILGMMTQRRRGSGKPAASGTMLLRPVGKGGRTSVGRSPYVVANVCCSLETHSEVPAQLW